MSVRERVLALKIKEKLEKNPEYAKKIGIWIDIIEIKNKELKKGE